jgi:hypothetical protein
VKSIYVGDIEVNNRFEPYPITEITNIFERYSYKCSRPTFRKSVSLARRIASAVRYGASVEKKKKNAGVQFWWRATRVNYPPKIPQKRKKLRTRVKNQLHSLKC